MNLVAIQLDCVWEDKSRNFARVLELLAAEPPAPGSLVVLPEMFSTGFSYNVAVTCQTAAREDETFLAQLAAEFEVTVLGGAVTRDPAGSVHNEAIAFGPEGHRLARYTKQRVFSPGGEAAVHTPGKTTVTFPWNGFTVAPLVCYDLRFPELFRAAAAQGAEVFAVIAAWPARRERHWLTLLQARAIENQAYVIGVNRVGQDPQATYSGRSVVVDPHGIIIADAGQRETLLTAPVYPAVVAEWRRDFPALRDAGLGSATR
jgi:predicted amidohydrolase